MKILDQTSALALLAELLVIRLAGYDQQRQALYAVPLAFVLDGATVLIAVGAGGRLARLLDRQRHGICVEADEVLPDGSFRSVIGTADVEALPDPLYVLARLAGRYGARWGRWRPAEPVQAYRLRFTDIQGRDNRKAATVQKR